MGLASRMILLEGHLPRDSALNHAWLSRDVSSLAIFSVLFHSVLVCSILFDSIPLISDFTACAAPGSSTPTKSEEQLHLRRRRMQTNE